MIAKLGKAPGPDGIIAEAIKSLQVGGVISGDEISHYKIIL